MKIKGVIEDIMDTLHSLARQLVSREESPSIGIIDSSSVKTSHYADPSCKGIDENKKVKGRKEHIVVDTLGLPLAVAVQETNLHDSKGASRYLPMEITKDRLGIRWLINSVGWLKSCSDQTSVQPNSLSCLKDEL